MQRINAVKAPWGGGNGSFRAGHLLCGRVGEEKRTEDRQTALFSEKESETGEGIRGDKLEPMFPFMGWDVIANAVEMKGIETWGARKPFYH